MVKTLLERFVQRVPSPAHRTALEACALVRVTTELLLGEMLGIPASGSTAEGVHGLFEWLRELSFIESGTEGIFPHDWRAKHWPLTCAGVTPIGI